MEPLFFLIFQTSVPVFTELTFHSFQFPHHFSQGSLDSLPMRDFQEVPLRLTINSTFNNQRTNKIGLFSFPSKHRSWTVTNVIARNGLLQSIDSGQQNIFHFIPYISYHTMLSEVQSMSSMNQFVTDIHRE